MTTDPSKLQHAEKVHFPLEEAYLCCDMRCSRIGNCSDECPACSNKSLLSVARLLAGEHAAPIQTEVQS